MSTEAQPRERLLFVDALRGMAVVFMVPLHTSHGWVRPDARTGEIWTASQFFGGLAAPIFLFLAGASLGVRWAGLEARGRTPQTAKDIARGAQLLVLGYVLRLQMWVIDGAGYARPSTYLAQAALLAAYGLAYYAASQLPSHRWRALGLGLGATLPFAFGLYQVSLHAPERFRGLLRVDVLQCIGACLIALSATAAVSGKAFARYAQYLVLAVIVGLLTSWFRLWVPGPLPEAVASYLAQWPAPDGMPVMALFPLFPWLAYAYVGAAIGLLWGRLRSSQLDAVLVGLVALGAILALVTSEAWTPIFNLTVRQPWVVQPLRVVYKLGLIMTLLGVAVASCNGFSQSASSPLQVMGRASLLIYWVHLEFAFGAAAHLLSRRLDLLEWAVGSLCLLAAMWLLAYVRVVGPKLSWPFRRVVPG